MEPITKNELIEGILRLFLDREISIDITISQIQTLTEDKRINWKT